MKVHAVCGYRSHGEAWPEEWSQDHYRTMKLIKAIKAETFRGYATFKTTNPDRSWEIRDTSQGRARALSLAGAAIAAKIKSAGYKTARVVPVPSSSHVTPGQPFTGANLAAAIEEANSAYRALPALYFAKAQAPSHAGGSRRPADILRDLRSSKMVVDAPIVLLDDVLTSGGHLRAAARLFEAQGIQVKDAFVVGRTLWAPPEHGMLKIDPEDLAV